MIVLFVATTMVSAFLVLVIQPIMARSILPLLGGGPSVWTASLLFFQLALLAGYCYAHLLVRFLGPRRNGLVHLVVLGISIAALPVAVPSGWIPPTTTSPVLWVLGLFAVMAGLPFVVASATSPLVQRWLAASGNRRASDPYPLYAAGNLGSAGALLVYPTLVEPSIGLADQRALWGWGFAILCVAIAGCAVFARGSQPDVETPAEPKIPPGRRWLWVVLAAVPASLLVGTTAHISRDIAAIPLLWIVPLALYMLSFTVAFSERGLPVITFARRALPMMMVAVVVTLLIQADRPIWLLASLHLAGFATVALSCHGALASSRPGGRDVTTFYLWLAVGGASGGLFNALLAPLLFDTFVEYPAGIVAACFVISIGREPSTRRGDALAMGAVAGLTLVGLLVVEGAGFEGVAARAIAIGLPALVSFTFAERARRFALGLLALIVTTSVFSASTEEVLHQDRTFFGAHKIVVHDGLHQLLHGNTIHGVQRYFPRRSTEPLAYYHPSGPAGDLLEELPAGSRIALIGLGTGALSCYGDGTYSLTVFEIDPAVVRIAKDEDLFSYLAECAPTAEIELGDGRTSIAATADSSFDLIVVDAFSSDAIPTHLLTVEAVDVYLSKLSTGGSIAFHISNRYIDLGPVIADVAATLDLAAYDRVDLLSDDSEVVAGKSASRWAVVLPAGAAAPGSGWEILQSSGRPPWTDDRSDVLSVIRFN